MIGLAALLSGIVVWSLFGELHEATRAAATAKEAPIEAR